MLMLLQVVAEFNTSNSSIPYWLTLLNGNYFVFLYILLLGIAFYYKDNIVPTVIFIGINLLVYLDIIMSESGTFYDYIVNFMFTCLILYNLYRK